MSAKKRRITLLDCLAMNEWQRRRRLCGSRKGSRINMTNARISSFRDLLEVRLNPISGSSFIGLRSDGRRNGVGWKSVIYDANGPGAMHGQKPL